MPLRIVQCDVIIQRGVDRARPQPVWDCPQTEHPERARTGEAEQRNHRHEYAGGGDPARAEAARQPVGHQA